MPSFDERTVTVVRHEYVLKSPAPWGEVGKAMAVATQAMESAGKDPSYDNAAYLEARDDEVVLYWIEEKKA